ncbi:MAG TPA: type IV pilus modification protein PilV [Lysobacter sp.]|nr:type IV pilus modification protein PilV [Lysobacter sp.]
MTRPRILSSRQSGFSMMEVLVSLLIILLGLMGLAGLLTRMQQAEFESYQRAQALVLLHDMVERIGLHRVTDLCFRLTDSSTGTPYLGTGSGGAPACAASTSNDNTQADNTLAEWHSLLQGAAETKGGLGAGAMVGARGCISYDLSSELLAPDGTTVLDGTGIYTVSVSWQGTTDTFAPTVNCANGLYGTPATADTRRRTVSTTFRLAHLK